MLRFADDIAIMGESEQEFSEQLNIMDEVLSKEYNLRINKTKVMVCNKYGQYSMNILSNRKKIEETIEFTYLGSTITEDIRSKREILSRIRQAEVAFKNKWK